MELRTFRAPTMHDALAMVRRELGPDAAVLHTREVRTPHLRLVSRTAADRGDGLLRGKRAQPAAAVTAGRSQRCGRYVPVVAGIGRSRATRPGPPKLKGN